MGLKCRASKFQVTCYLDIRTCKAHSPVTNSHGGHWVLLSYRRKTGPQRRGWPPDTPGSVAPGEGPLYCLWSFLSVPVLKAVNTHPRSPGFRICRAERHVSWVSSLTESPLSSLCWRPLGDVNLLSWLASLPCILFSFHWD